MIFVTIGSAVKVLEFARLIRKMDEIAKKLDEKVVMQIGSVNYKPVNAEYFEYTSYQENLSYFQKASLIVGHGGIGTMLNALRFQKPIIVVPRRMKYGELNFDDHQVEVFERLKGMALIHVVYEIEELEGTLRKVLAENPSPAPQEPLSERKMLIEAIKKFVREEG